MQNLEFRGVNGWGVTFSWLCPSLPGDLLDDQCVRSLANILFAGDRYVLASERHQFGILRRGGRFAVDGEEDGAIVAKDDECRTVFCACLGTGYADGLSRPLV